MTTSDDVIAVARLLNSASTAQQAQAAPGIFSGAGGLGAFGQLAMQAAPQMAWQQPQINQVGAFNSCQPCGSSVSQQAGRPFFSSGVQCFRCGGKGHFARDCPTQGDNRFDRRVDKEPTEMEKMISDGACPKE